MIQSFGVTSASVSDRGLSEKRPQNEDAFLEIPQSGIFAVADGVGGAQAGEVASQMAMEILGEAFINVDERADAEEVMRRALMQANSAINQMSHELPQLAQMATTVVALHIAGNIATIGHAGDSRLYRLDSDGILHRETDDHSVVAEEVRAGRMTEAQAENHPGKNIISRALGAEPTIDIETKTIMVGENSTFLICSDGVTRHINDAEIKGLLGAQADLQAICDRIKQLCSERGAEDNLTAVIVRLGAAERAAAYSVPHFAELGKDEVTVAGARSQNSISPGLDEEDDDDLLEIQTRSLRPLKSPDDEPELLFDDLALGPNIEDETDSTLASEAIYGHTADGADTEDIPPKTALHSPAASESPAVQSEPAISNINEPVPEEESSEGTSFEGDTSTTSSKSLASQSDLIASREDSESKAPASRALASIGLLLLGSLVGLGAYHFFLADRSQLAPTLPITEMQSSNQPQTAFEENRRTLDKNPAAALPRYEAEPGDAENRFLVGRANLLLGRYPEARKAFQESRDLIAAGQVDPDNAQTIKTEIAIAMAVTNDTLVQNSLKKELDESRAQPPVNSSAHPNR